MRTREPERTGCVCVNSGFLPEPPCLNCPRRGRGKSMHAAWQRRADEHRLRREVERADDWYAAEVARMAERAPA